MTECLPAKATPTTVILVCLSCVDRGLVHVQAAPLLDVDEATAEGRDDPVNLTKDPRKQIVLQKGELQANLKELTH